MCGSKRRPILLSPLWITYLQVNKLVYHSYIQILTETLYYWVRDKGYFIVAAIKVARRSPFLCMSPNSKKMMRKELGCLHTEWLCYKKGQAKGTKHLIMGNEPVLTLPQRKKLFLLFVLFVDIFGYNQYL